MIGVVSVVVTLVEVNSFFQNIDNLAAQVVTLAAETPALSVFIAAGYVAGFRHVRQVMKAWADNRDPTSFAAPVFALLALLLGWGGKVVFGSLGAAGLLILVGTPAERATSILSAGIVMLGGVVAGTLLSVSVTGVVALVIARRSRRP